MARRVLITGACLAAMLAVPAGASARSHDRNHDGIPDGWERAHHLSLRVNQARRDQDHDGLRNRAEFRAHTNPRKADTDGDGIEDGAEHAGRIASFTGGVLTIEVFGGRTLTGTVDDTTEIECDDAHASDAGDRGDDHGDDPSDDDDAAARCDTSALTAGAVVKEAELGDRGVFEKVELR